LRARLCAGPEAKKLLLRSVSLPGVACASRRRRDRHQRQHLSATRWAAGEPIECLADNGVPQAQAFGTAGRNNPAVLPVLDLASAHRVRLWNALILNAAEDVDRDVRRGMLPSPRTSGEPKGGLSHPSMDENAPPAYAWPGTLRHHIKPAGFGGSRQIRSFRL
jgi:hypothetical protein